MESVQHFVYDAMEQPSNQIRLCRIKPKVKGSPLEIDMETYLLESIKGHFAALSYAWGEQESTSPIIVNGIALGAPAAFLTRNLYTHLYRLRELEYTELLWIDALCINQSDTEEKQHQVALMARIFRSAHGVLVGLDEANTSFDEAKADHELVRAVLQQLGDGTHIHEMASITRLKEYDTVRVLCRVSDSAWFQRVWVVQEVCLAATSYVLFADNLLPWTTFGKAFDRWNALRREVCCSSIIEGLGPQVQLAFHRVYIHLASIEHTKAALGEGQHILEAMLCFQHLDAKLLVDKFNGYRGLHKGDPMPPPDYRTSPEEVFEQLTVWLVHSCQSLLPLALGLQNLGCGMALPSWVLDISANPPINHNYWRARIELYKAYPCILGDSLNMSYDPRHVGQLRLGGVEVDHIRSVARRCCESLDRAGHIELLNEWCQFATGQPISSLVVESPRGAAFCATMLGGWVRKTSADIWRKANTGDLLQWRQDVMSMKRDSSDSDRYDQAMFPHLTAVLGQVLFKTKSGSLGLGPQSLKSGDALWAFAGGRTIFAIRKLPSAGLASHGRPLPLVEEHTLLGSCYHNELMQGTSGIGSTLDQLSVCVIS